MEGNTQSFLDVLHRGGAYRVLAHPSDGRHIWAPTSEPLPDMTGKRGWGFCVNPLTCIPSRNGTGKPRAPMYVGPQNKHIAAMGSLFGDFDAKLFALKTDPDLDLGMGRALQHIRALPVQPSAMVASGGGFHCYWILPEPWPITNEDDRAKAASILKRWVAFVGADPAAAALSQCLRLPGTLNAKPEYGTPRTEIGRASCRERV